ncbi:hypothetical protein Bbelb_040900 [Branchiostoma belcheri]|nr:hypothetical protein Bbelb_040900 [Branchiostoma belcheri]
MSQEQDCGMMVETMRSFIRDVVIKPHDHPPFRIFSPRGFYLCHLVSYGSPPPSGILRLPKHLSYYVVHENCSDSPAEACRREKTRLTVSAAQPSCTVSAMFKFLIWQLRIVGAVQQRHLPRLVSSAQK